MRVEKEFRFPWIMNIIHRIIAAFYCLFGSDVVCLRMFKRRNDPENEMSMTAYVLSDYISGKVEQIAQAFINEIKTKEE